MSARNLYQKTDQHFDEPAAFVLPNIPCGTYTSTNMFGETTKFQFRRMPRAAKHTGKFGLFYYDADAGNVLMGVYDPDTGLVEKITKLYPQVWEAWGVATLEGKACAWCGKKLDDTERKTHKSKACDRETQCPS